MQDEKRAGIDWSFLFNSDQDGKIVRLRRSLKTLIMKKKLYTKDLTIGNNIPDMKDVMFVPATGLHMSHNVCFDYVLCLGSADRPDLAMWREATPHEVRKYWDYMRESNLV